jgi:hypothetical protein
VDLNVEQLKKIKKFYLWELKKEGLTESKRAKYLLALKSIEKIIKEKERSGEKRKHKRFIAYDHKTVFQDNKSYRGY